MHCDVIFDGSGQVGDAAKHTVAQAIGRDVAEEPFDHVQPRRRGGCEMNMESGGALRSTS